MTYLHLYLRDNERYFYLTIFLRTHCFTFRTLQEHPMLLQLYRDLVITQVISSEEFWSQHAAEYTQAKKIQRQEIGVNSAFLVGIFYDAVEIFLYYI